MYNMGMFPSLSKVHPAHSPYQASISDFRDGEGDTDDVSKIAVHATDQKLFLVVRLQCMNLIMFAK